MKYKLILLTLLLSSYMFVNLSAQEMPLVYDVENTGAGWITPYMPSFSELPAIEALPDPFKWSDGRGQISNFSDWRYRRAEIKSIIEHYEIGEKPVRPDSIEASYSNGTLTVNVTVNGNTLTLTSPVILPEGDGPFPAVIGMGGPTGSIPSDIFTSRDIAQISFNYSQVMAHTQSRGDEPINALYPDLIHMGAYSAWPWGVSRLIDGLELVADDLNIDLKHLAVTGCSFAGKMALYAGAFDERIALTISQESGGGGYTTWRYSETMNGVETIAVTNYAWFLEDLRKFGGSRVSNLPFDHHELMAMVAPRALLVTGNPGWEWLADESGHVGSNATKEVYEALGIPDRFAYSLIGDHGHCAVPESQIPDIEAFVEKFLLGNESANTDVSISPYTTDLSPWITWTTPTLSNDTSFYGWTSLVYPTNLQMDLDNSSTFIWNKHEDAEKYLIQISRDAKFTSIFITDSTTTDTAKTINGLLDNNKYYWRIQVKSDGGSAGPWSDVWNFSTTLSVPPGPQLISASLVQNRGYLIRLRWNKVNIVDQYLIQISEDQSFTTISKTDSTVSDTVKNVSGVSEGKKYYWRVRAKNIIGIGEWSEISNFTIIRAPIDLQLHSSILNEMRLTWDDKSAVEDGYIIERVQSPDTIFTFLDSIIANSTEYIDNTFELNQEYLYRVKAYKESAESEYSNEASSTLVGVEKVEIPREYSLGQNYPNPFNPTTTISFIIPEKNIVKLTVFDFLGKEIAILVDEEKPSGSYTVEFDASSLTSGVYFYRLQTDKFTDTKKFILLK